MLDISMNIAMKDEEIKLLCSVLDCTKTYVEFGSGGSTCLSASIVEKVVFSVDSSQEWLDKVAYNCQDDTNKAKLRLIYADIGPTVSWGWPENPSQRDRWPNYHEKIWTDPASRDADTYLVDGRFRMACFMQSIIHGRPDSVILIHDFLSRPEYDSVHLVAREIARAGELSAFIRKSDYNTAEVERLLELHRFDPT